MSITEICPQQCILIVFKLCCQRHRALQIGWLSKPLGSFLSNLICSPLGWPESDLFQLCWNLHMCIFGAIFAVLVKQSSSLKALVHLLSYLICRSLGMSDFFILCWNLHICIFGLDRSVHPSLNSRNWTLYITIVSMTENKSQKTKSRSWMYYRQCTLVTKSLMNYTSIQNQTEWSCLILLLHSYI